MKNKIDKAIDKSCEHRSGGIAFNVGARSRRIRASSLRESMIAKWWEVSQMTEAPENTHHNGYIERRRTWTWKKYASYEYASAWSRGDDSGAFSGTEFRKTATVALSSASNQFRPVDFAIKNCFTKNMNNRRMRLRRVEEFDEDISGRKRHIFVPWEDGMKMRKCRITVKFHIQRRTLKEK